jgi:predicted DNA-binding transcriptional regulator AlpA
MTKHDYIEVPISERLLLNFREAAMLLSMSEQSLRDLVHKGQGPENVRRGKRVCFTQEGLRKYVDKLPREYPYQGIIETITADGAKPMSIEEQRVFGT